MKGAPDPNLSSSIAGGQALIKWIQLTNQDLMLTLNALLDTGANGKAFIHPQSLYLLQN